MVSTVSHGPNSQHVHPNPNPLPPLQPPPPPPATYFQLSSRWFYALWKADMCAIPSPTLPWKLSSVDGAAEPRVRRAATVSQLSPCLTFSLRSVASDSGPGTATSARSRSHAATRPGLSAWGIPASGRGSLGTPCSTCTACTRKPSTLPCGLVEGQS